MSTKNLLMALLRHLTTKRRKQIGLLVIVMLISGVAELVTIGSVLPFLAVLSNPDQIWKIPYIQEFSIRAGITTSKQLLIPSIILFQVSAVFAAIVRLANLWLNGQLAASIGSDLSCEAYRRTLYQPYKVHVSRNSSEIIAVTTSQIDLTVAAINAFLQLITSLIVAAGIFTGLFLIDASIAFLAISLFGSAYWLLAVNVRRKLFTNGLKITEASNQLLKALQEGLGAIRDVLLENTQKTYLEIYQTADRPQRKLQAKNNFLRSFPRFALEALGMVCISLLGGYLILQSGEKINVIAILGALALGAQRLLPALQQVYGSWASLKGYNGAMSAVIKLIGQDVPQDMEIIENYNFEKSIKLENLYFRYTLDSPYILKNVNLEIKAGERIGIIGSTGSGKSTAVDLIMGLLEPTLGVYYVDNVNLFGSKTQSITYSWRSLIAHVPQSIYLTDNSIAENIAFGENVELIDMTRVREVAKQAQISAFIESLPLGYSTFVGERGIRLSGGQRQRIGIARAMYRSKKILVLDEATSALDIQTEKMVMNSIANASEKLTVIIIAHRLSTLSFCDRVYEIKNGCINLKENLYEQER